MLKLRCPSRICSTRAQRDVFVIDQGDRAIPCGLMDRGMAHFVGQKRAEQDVRGQERIGIVHLEQLIIARGPREKDLVLFAVENPEAVVVEMGDLVDENDLQRARESQAACRQGHGDVPRHLAHSRARRGIPVGHGEQRIVAERGLGYACRCRVDEPQGQQARNFRSSPSHEADCGRSGIISPAIAALPVPRVSPILPTGDGGTP
jgi:hypothetical protein